MSDEIKDAPEYMDYARRALRTGKLALDDGDLVGAINRAYYAIFYAANAVLELAGLQRNKHSGVLALFREKHVKTGKIETDFSDIYGQAFESRQEVITNAPSFRAMMMLAPPSSAQNDLLPG